MGSYRSVNGPSIHAPLYGYVYKLPTKCLGIMPGQKGKGKRCHEGEGEGQILSELVLPYL